MVQLRACYRGYVIICVLRPYIGGGIVGYNGSDGAPKAVLQEAFKRRSFDCLGKWQNRRMASWAQLPKVVNHYNG